VRMPRKATLLGMHAGAGRRFGGVVRVDSVQAPVDHRVHLRTKASIVRIMNNVGSANQTARRVGQCLFHLRTFSLRGVGVVAGAERVSVGIGAERDGSVSWPEALKISSGH